MAIGERIRFFRNMKGITQKYLGMVVGFPERSADVRMAQYETGFVMPQCSMRWRWSLRGQAASAFSMALTMMVTALSPTACAVT